MHSKNLKKIRLQNEFSDLKKHPPQNWNIIQVLDDDIICQVNADNSSPFYGKPFGVKVQIPQDYPKKGTKFYVLDPIIFHHPNIDNEDGKVCSSAIQSPMITIRERMNAFLLLLAVPNPQSCLNGEAGNQYISKKKQYYKKAVKIFRGLNPSKMIEN